MKSLQCNLMVSVLEWSVPACLPACQEVGSLQHCLGLCYSLLPGVSTNDRFFWLSTKVKGLHSKTRLFLEGQIDPCIRLELTKFLRLFYGARRLPLLNVNNKMQHPQGPAVLWPACTVQADAAGEPSKPSPGCWTLSMNQGKRSPHNSQLSGSKLLM